MKVFITKYALSKGIFECDVSIVETCVKRNMVKQNDSVYGIYYHKPDWHETEDEAKKRVIEMIEAKRKSIKKELDKLELLEKEINP